MTHAELGYELMTSSIPAADGDDDALLLNRFCESGDTEAFDVLFKRHLDVAYHLALRMCGNSADAEDIVQSSFLQVFRNARQFRGHSSVRGWMMSVVVNECRRTLRDEAVRKRNQQSAPIRDAIEPGLDHENAELRAAAVRVLEGLPERYRLPVFLHHLCGLSHHEVACALALPEETTRKQATRGIQQIREALSASGYVAGAIAIPQLLESVSLPPAPAGLAGALKAALAATSAAPLAAPAAAGKGLAAVLTGKSAVAAGLVLVCAATIALTAGRGRTAVGPKADEPPVTAAPARENNAGAPATANAALAELLNRKIDADYRFSDLSGVLTDLDERFDLHSAFPKPIGTAFDFNLEEKDITVKAVLEKLAAAGKLELEYHDNIIVFWKKSDDALLAELGKRLKDGDISARGDALYDLAKQSDPRIYPLIFAALNDKDEAIASEAVLMLNTNHSDTVRFGADVQSAVPSIVKLLQAPHAETYKDRAVLLLGSTRAPEATAALISILKDPSLLSTAALALGRTHDARAIEPLISVLKQSNPEKAGRVPQALLMFHEPMATDAVVAFLKALDAKTRGQALSQLSARDSRVVEFLLDLLSDPDPRVRTSACVALSRSRDPRKVERLLPLLNDPDANARTWAAEALANSQDPRVLGPLLALLKNPDSNTRISAANALHGAHDPHTIEAILALSTDPTPGVRAAVAAALRTTHGPRVLPTLIALSKDGNAEVRKAAAATLAVSRDPGSIEPYITLLNDPDSGVSWQALIYSNTWLTRDPRVMAALKSIWNNPQSQNRDKALSAFLDSEDPAELDLLVSNLKSDGPENSMTLLTELLNCSLNPHVVGRLLPLLNDPNVATRATVASALSSGNTVDVRVIEPLFALTTDPVEQVRMAAVEGLIHLRDPRGYDAASDLLASATEDWIRGRVANLLSQFPGATERLIVQAKHVDPKSRAAAARALGKRPQGQKSLDPRAIETLILLTRDVDPAVRISAVEALTAERTVSDPGANDALIALAKDTDPAVRKCIAKALGYSSDPRTPAALISLSKDADPAVRGGVAYALLSTKSSAVIDVGIAMLKDPDASIQRMVMIALCRQSNSQAAGGLVAWLKADAAHTDLRLELAHTAEVNLYNQRDAPTIDVLLALLQDKSEAVRSKTASLLKKWADKEERIRTALTDYETARQKKSAPPSSDF